MKCNICKNEIEGYGNNPWPICRPDDYNSKCCDECNTNYVIPMRILSSKYSMHSNPNFIWEPEVDDVIVVVYLHDDPFMKEYIGRKGRIEYIDDMGQLHGAWGGLAVNPEVDNYIIIEE